MKTLAVAKHHVFFTLLVTLLIGACLLAAAPAWAQAAAPIDGVVVVPWGEIVAGVVVGWGGWLAAKILAFVPLQWRTNQILNAAVQWGLNTTPGAVRGQALTLEVGSEVLERVMEYLVARAPDLLEKLGGRIGARPLAIARMEFAADVDARALIPPRGGVAPQG